MRNYTSKLVGLAAVAVVLPLAACHVFDVQSPGRIADSNLNSAEAVPGIVTGMSYDLAQAMNSGAELTSLAAEELWHGGSYNWGDVPRGIILPEDVNGFWGSMMQARWVAEHGIERIKTILDPADFAKSDEVARGYLLAGFANRLIGENVCQTVIDGGSPQPNTVEFDRGIDHFNNAITIGQAAGSSADDIVTAAYAGRASLEAWKGDWAGAAADAAKVPDDFSYSAVLMTEGASNTLSYETHTRYEYTVYNTLYANHPDDPRIPWKIIYLANGKVATGANGSTPMYQQNKYVDLGDDIPLVKGTEMLVLRAEGALRNNDIAGAYDLMNQARTVYGMAALPVTSTIDSAWADLHYERAATTWLEVRRLWDEHRWFAETGPAHLSMLSQPDDLKDRQTCIPISQNEMQSNPNARP